MTGETLPGVSRTAIGIAALRAFESSRPDRLFEDPYAQAFAEAGYHLLPGTPDKLPAVEDGSSIAALGAMFYEHAVIRTRFYDEYLQAAVDGGCAQVVLLAAGLDTRAFRLAWPAGLRLFELDLPEMLEFKQRVLDEQGATARCDRTTVVADLREDWPDRLTAAGFQPDAPTAWLAEGLLVYLSFEEAARMLTAVGELSAPGSRISFEHRGENDSLLSRARALDGVGEVTGLWKGGLSGRALEWLGEHGWQARTYERTELAAGYGRASEQPSSGGFLVATRA